MACFFCLFFLVCIDAETSSTVCDTNESNESDFQNSHDNFFFIAHLFPENGRFWFFNRFLIFVSKITEDGSFHFLNDPTSFLALSLYRGFPLLHCSMLC